MKTIKGEKKTGREQRWRRKNIGEVEKGAFFKW